jgi:predicted RNA-binding Zn-ribbon protein involved in translation (DUF1610 family)
MNDHTVTHKILCNACKVELELVPDSDPESWRCPSCGISDTRENVIGEAKKYVIEMVSRRLQDKARETAAKVRFAKFSGEPIPKGDYRFITDTEPTSHLP